MEHGALIGLAVGVTMAGIGLLVAYTARRSYLDRSRPRKVISFTTDKPADRVRAALLGLADGGKYKVEEDHPERCLMTLGSNPTLFSFGFFFPVYIEPQQNGPTQLTIGIESKFMQAGPVVTHHHEQFVARLKKNLDN
jgi:hypothetical protein